MQERAVAPSILNNRAYLDESNRCLAIIIRTHSDIGMPSFFASAFIFLNMAGGAWGHVQ